MEVLFKNDIEPEEIEFYSYIFIRYYMEEFMNYIELVNLEKDFAKCEYYSLAESTKRALKAIKIIFNLK